MKRLLARVPARFLPDLILRDSFQHPVCGHLRIHLALRSMHRRGARQAAQRTFRTVRNLRSEFTLTYSSYWKVPSEERASRGTLGKLISLQLIKRCSRGGRIELTANINIDLTSSLTEEIRKNSCSSSIVIVTRRSKRRFLGLVPQRVARFAQHLAREFESASKPCLKTDRKSFARLVRVAVIKWNLSRMFLPNDRPSLSLVGRNRLVNSNIILEE